MRRTVLLVLALAATAGGAWWWVIERKSAPAAFALYGNVDLRQVQLAFNNSERIASVLAEEGERLRGGQVVAKLDTSRLEPQVAQAQARVNAQRQVVEKLHHGNRPQEIAQARAQSEAQRAVVEKLHNGSRPEEIGQARANVEAARAEAVNARRRYERLKKLSAVRLADQTQVQAVSQEEVDDAQAALDEADAKLTASQKSLELVLIGPRREEIAEAEARLALNKKALELWIVGPREEDIAEAEAQLRADEAQLAFVKQQLADTELKVPADAVVRARLLEPGEMSSPQRPVYSLAITNPKWVRVYVSETDLGKVRPGMPGSVAIDSFPGRRFEGWVGFISHVAEFTPKAVQTEELRTSLVFEVRVFVKDPSDELPLGMPATVYLSPAEPGASALEDRR
jgi:HlyD family secretion protein